MEEIAPPAPIKAAEPKKEELAKKPTEKTNEKKEDPSVKQAMDAVKQILAQ